MVDSKKVKLTIITPYYNQKDSIEETILSVLNQTLESIEYIIIDDGSDDGGSEIIKKYSDRLTFLKQENKGQVRTQNQGWAMARGKYIGYLSADDTVDPRCYEILYDYLESEEEKVVLAFPQNDLIDVQSKIIKKKVSKDFNLYETISTSECYIGAGAIFRSSYFQEFGGWDANYRIMADRAYFIYMARKYDLKLISKAKAYYRYHENSSVVAIKGSDISLEYVKFLDILFSDFSDLRSIQDKSYSNAFLLVSINSFKNFEFFIGFKYFFKSVYLDRSKLYPFNIFLVVRRIMSRSIKKIIARINFRDK